MTANLIQYFFLIIVLFNTQLDLNKSVFEKWQTIIYLVVEVHCNFLNFITISRKFNKVSNFS